MPPLVAAAIAAAVPATAATIGATGVTYASVIASVLTTAASTALQYALREKPKQTRTETMVRESAAARFCVYGRVQLAGACVFYRAYPVGSALYRIAVLGHGETDGFETIKFNGKVVTFDFPAGWCLSAPYKSGSASRAKVFLATGADDQVSWIDQPGASVDPLITSVWTSAHTLSGIPYIVCLFADCDDPKRQAHVFPKGEPTCLVVKRGVRVWDFRDGGQSFETPATWTWTRNPVLIRVHYLMKSVLNGGRAIPASKIDFTSHIEAANQCDEAVALKGGGTVPRYQFDGTQDFVTKCADVLAMFDATCDGQTFRTSTGLVGYRVGKARVAPPELTFSVSDGSIISYSEVQQGSGRLAEFNVVKPKFTSPEHEYQFLPCQEWREETWITRDGLDRPQPLELSEVQGFSQIRRLSKIYIRKANPEWKGTIRTTLKGLRAYYAPMIHIAIAEIGLDTDAEVLSLTPVIDPNSNLIRYVDIVWRSLAADTYDWNAATEEGEPPPPLPSSGADSTVEAPTDTEYTVGAGPRIVAAADQRTFGAGTLDIRWRPTGAADWAGENTGTANHAETANTLTSAAGYDVSVKWLVNGNDSQQRESIWTDPVTITATVDATAPTAATGLTATVANGGGLILLEWTNSTASSVVRNTLFRASSASPGNAIQLYDYWGSRGEIADWSDEGLTQSVSLYFVRSYTADGAYADTSIVTVDTSGAGGTKNIIGIGGGKLLGAGGGNYLGWGPI